jgi:hypothetical protein
LLQIYGVTIVFTIAYYCHRLIKLLAFLAVLCTIGANTFTPIRAPPCHSIH